MTATTRAEAPTTRTRRVLLHVGAPKTGTSLLQDSLFAHRETLRGQGVLYPADRADAHFLAALDLLQLPWGGLEQDAVGRWDRLAAEVRAWPGTSIVSHEILGTASRTHVQRALADLGGDDAEVHLIYSARDLLRQVPAEWQENLKHRRTSSYADFLAGLRDPERRDQVAQWFWSVQELPDVLGRWGATLPPERVHVVTVPPPGAAPTALWERFLAAFGLTGSGLVPGDRVNASLGVTESAVLRHLNERVLPGMPPEHYRRLVREDLVHLGLAGRPGSRSLTVPPDVRDWIVELAQGYVAELRARGYAVVGDLDDLLVTGEPKQFVDPDAVPGDVLAEAALDALAIMTLAAAEVRSHEVSHEAHIADLRAQLAVFHASTGYRARKRLVELASDNPAARLGYAGYRRLRGSSSRSA